MSLKLTLRRRRNMAKIIVWQLIDSYLRSGGEPDKDLEAEIRLIGTDLLRSMGDAAMALAEKDHRAYNLEPTYTQKEPS